MVGEATVNLARGRVKLPNLYDIALVVTHFGLPGCCHIDIVIPAVGFTQPIRQGLSKIFLDFLAEPAPHLG